MIKYLFINMKKKTLWKNITCEHLYGLSLPVPTLFAPPLLLWSPPSFEELVDSFNISVLTKLTSYVLNSVRLIKFIFFNYILFGLVKAWMVLFCCWICNWICSCCWCCICWWNCCCCMLLINWYCCGLFCWCCCWNRGCWFCWCIICWLWPHLLSPGILFKLLQN